MNGSRLGRPVLGALVVAGVLAGCGGAGTGVTPGAMAQSRAGQALGTSWMLPESSGENLLYVLEVNTEIVDVYSYPGLNFVGQLTGFGETPTGLCADEQGDVFVTEEYNVGGESLGNHILEFVHGGTSPIASLSDSSSPWSCSVDRTTGDLAVTNFVDNSVAIYPNAEGTPTYISTSLSQTYYAAYDSRGDLFVSGNTGPSSYGLVELLSGRSRFKKVSLNEVIGLGALQWNGGYLVASFAPAFSKTWYLYRMKVSGSKGNVVDTAVLDFAKIVRYGQRQSLILGNFVLAGSTSLRRWRYPSGGKAVKTLVRHFSPKGIALSVAPSGARIGK